MFILITVWGSDLNFEQSLYNEVIKVKEWTLDVVEDKKLSFLFTFEVFFLLIFVIKWQLLIAVVDFSYLSMNYIRPFRSIKSFVNLRTLFDISDSIQITEHHYLFSISSSPHHPYYMNSEPHKLMLT